MATEFEMRTQPMRLSQGSVLQFSPDPGWEVQFTEPDDEKTHTLPMIGWAVTVQWTGYHVPPDEAEATEKKANAETDIKPVVLADTGPEILSHYLSDSTPPRTTWRISRTDA
ncbi:hypothetical protein [Amycolatopsis coloradensis]|uniref:hypothetical protein n=1 Tax=Amycolatopsis coloradensis TaxID=76021 RepID=UPI001177FC3C|nr:hypothetical protein [Amycolatopsis coloradensis]